MATRAPQRLIWLPTGGHIGDAVMILSLFAEIIERTPGVTIDYLVRRNASFIADLAQAYPAITVIPVSSSIVRMFALIKSLFVDRAVVIAPPPWGARPFPLKVLSFLLRLRGDRVVAFDDGGARWFYSETIAHDKSKRYIDNLRSAARGAGFATLGTGIPPRLKINTSLPPDFPFADKPYLAIHPFPHMSTAKTLPLRRWKTLVQEIASRYPAYGIVVTGAEVDRASAEELAAVVPGVYLAIARPLTDVAGIIEHAALYLGVDTGPTHIAGVLHAPSVILAQQKEPMWLPTYNPNATLIWEKKNCTCGTATPCGVEEEGKPYRRCVYDLSDETILGAITAKLGTV